MSRDEEFPRIHDRPALLAFIRSRLDAEGRLDDSVMGLPDQAERRPDVISFMAGALDGTMGHHAGGTGQATERAETVADLIARAGEKSSERRLRKLYEAIADDDVLSFVDPMIEALARRKPSTSDVARVATWLASTAPDRAAVKVGIALLGITGAPDGTLLHDLGSHEEFTLYAVVAFANSRADPEPDIYELAKRVRGWGRIQCVERLRNTTNPAIARWILVEGFRNSVMNEYLAFIAATTGDLASALDDPDPEREVVAAAGDILDALIMGGPAEDIDDYPLAAGVLARWLDHMDDRAATIGDFLVIRSIHDFCERADGWDTRIASGLWSTSTRQALHAHASDLLRHPRWPSLVQQGLDAADRSTFWQADQAARSLGIDTFAHHLAVIDKDPLDGTWFQAWQFADTSRAETLSQRAATLLDLAAIASGASTAIGLGPEFKPHAALGWTLQALRGHPGIGAQLLCVGLQSPSIQNRHSAMNALESWGPTYWSSEHRELLRVVAASDPVDKVRQRASELLAADTSRLE